MGVPKGSIFSITLFSVYINSLADVLRDGMQGSLYVDEFVFCYKSKNMKSDEGHLQLCPYKIQNCLEAFRTSQVDSLSRQMNHLLIYADINLHCSTYNMKLKSNIDNPAFVCVFNPQQENLYDYIKKCIQSIGFRIL